MAETMEPTDVLNALLEIPTGITLPVALDDKGEQIWVRFTGDPTFDPWASYQDNSNYITLQKILTDGVMPEDAELLAEVMEDKGLRWTRALATTLTTYWMTGHLPTKLTEEERQKIMAGEGDPEVPLPEGADETS